MRVAVISVLLLGVVGPAMAQTPAQPSAQAPVPAAVGRMSVTDAKVTGAVSVSDGQVAMSSGASVMAGERGARVSLVRGGEVSVCSNSAVHHAAGSHAGEVMVSLDRGAVELRGTLGQFSDVVLTPDLRILVSGPAAEDVRVRTNQQGDTCIDNRAPAAAASATASATDAAAVIVPDAPYVTVTEQLGTGVYRVQSGQRVMFEHGSVAAVVDHEKEPCGCPPAPENLVAQSNPVTGNVAPAASTHTPEFPLAQSEGLAPPPVPATEPAVPAGTPHAQVTIPFAYDGSHPPPSAADTAPQPVAPAAAPPAPPRAPAAPASSGGDLWGAVKHFFGKIFAKKSEPAK